MADVSISSRKALNDQRNDKTRAEYKMASCSAFKRLTQSMKQRAVRHNQWILQLTLNHFGIPRFWLACQLIQITSARQKRGLGLSPSVKDRNGKFRHYHAKIFSEMTSDDVLRIYSQFHTKRDRISAHSASFLFYFKAG